MAINPNAKDLTAGVIGAGAMGRGIAQIMATGGIKVLLFLVVLSGLLYAVKRRIWSDLH